MSLLFIGCVMCGVAYIIGGMDLSKLDIDTAYKAQTYTLSSADIETIELDVDRHSILVKQSYLADSVTIDYYENEYDLFKAEEGKNTLSFTNTYYKNMLFRKFCMLFDKKNDTDRKITLTIPRNFSGTINIKSSKADVEVDGISSLETLNITLDDGDVFLKSVNCTNAIISLKSGELDVWGGIYENLDVTLANQAEYVPIDKVEGASPAPEATPSDEPEPDTTPEPEATPEVPADDEDPDATEEPADPDATEEPGDTDASPEPEETPLPTETPTPTRTPAPTKTPTVLAVTAKCTFSGVDCTNLKITVYNTNIEGSVSRGISYYNIETNNTESSNIKTTQNVNAVGKIVIEQNGGSTNIQFR